MFVWDYFMRRKWLLLTVLAIFMLSGTISGYFLQHSDTYTVNSTVLDRPEETPDEGTIARVQVPILSEEEANAIAVAESSERQSLDSPSAPEVAANDATENAGSIVDAPATVGASLEEPTSKPDDIEVPLTNQGAQADLNKAWLTLFSAWQQATWGILGAIAVALIAVLFARWLFLRKLS